MQFDCVVRSLLRSKPASSFSLYRNIKACGVAKMSSSNISYEEAMRKLNSLQSNKSLRDAHMKKYTSGVCTNIEDMTRYLSRIGISMAKLDELSVIHVAGTKGKGSTSAMCESILRSHGFRTGLYTSPHLVSVCERFRLNGELITREQFSRYCHQAHDLLKASQAFEGDMPNYFAFLTTVAFNLFLEENVDVAIIEVGIGGDKDFTNVLRKVPVIGITALGIDHTSMLGNTIDLIAECKAGIMKPGCEAYTVLQPRAAMPVLRRVASQVQCTLNIVPEFDSYIFPRGTNFNKILPVDVESYKTNASLAIQLAHSWMRINKLQLNQRKLRKKAVSGKIGQNDFIEIDSLYMDSDKQIDEMITTLPKETVIGLREFNWPGRYQTIRSDYATFCLDGAHTKESMEICADWFVDNNRTADKVLIFSATGDRDVEMLLQPLTNIEFKRVYFVTPYVPVSKNSDNFSLLGEDEDFLKRCHEHLKIWKKIQSISSTTLLVRAYVTDALMDIKRNFDDEVNRTSVLITGSLHLVGSALSILDPNLCRKD